MRALMESMLSRVLVHSVVVGAKKKQTFLSKIRTLLYCRSQHIFVSSCVSRSKLCSSSTFLPSLINRPLHSLLRTNVLGKHDHLIFFSNLLSLRK